jgi:hypothetical protein
MVSDLQVVGSIKSDDACGEDATEDTSFDFCHDDPCVWLSETENIVAVN